MTSTLPICRSCREIPQDLETDELCPFCREHGDQEGEHEIVTKSRVLRQAQGAFGFGQIVLWSQNIEDMYDDGGQWAVERVENALTLLKELLESLRG